MAVKETNDSEVLDLPFLVESKNNNEIVLKTKPRKKLSKKDKERFKTKQVTVKVFVFNDEDINELEQAKNTNLANEETNSYLYFLLQSIKNIILK